MDGDDRTMGRKSSDAQTTMGGNRVTPWYGRYLAVISIVTLLSMLAIYRSLRPSSSSSSSSSSSATTSIAKTRNAAELLPTYDLPLDSLGRSPLHLTPIDPSTLVPRGPVTIDDAHRDGMLHVGHVLFVLDASGSVLFLRRSTDVVTCPGTWSVLGEHATRGETPRDAVVRGVEEELGLEAQFDGEFGSGSDPAGGGLPGTFVVRFRARASGDEVGDVSSGAATGGSWGSPPLPVSIRNATEHPLYYIRHYGPRNENRVDSQLTYLWYAIFPENHDEISWRLDDEVADHRWVSLEDARTWLSNDAAGEDAGGEGEARQRLPDVGGGATRANDGDGDDGPDAGDFCHGTIRSLYEAGLGDILRRRQIPT